MVAVPITAKQWWLSPLLPLLPLLVQTARKAYTLHHETRFSRDELIAFLST